MSNNVNNNIATIAYHHVGFVPDSLDIARYAVTVDQFSSHLDWLLASPHQLLSLNDALTVKTEKPGGVVISFDDGYLSDYEHATPLLVERNLSGVFFVSAGNVGQPGYLNWQQLREMVELKMTIGAHGHDHTLFNELSDAALDDQLRRSRLELEDKLGVPVRSMSLPGGMGDANTVARAREHGFDFVFGSCPRRGQTRYWKTKVIPRLALRSHYGVPELQKLIEGTLFRAGLEFRYRSLRLLRSMVGRNMTGKLSRAATGIANAARR